MTYTTSLKLIIVVILFNGYVARKRLVNFYLFKGMNVLNLTQVNKLNILRW